MDPVLDVDGLYVSFPGRGRTLLPAVEDLGFAVRPGETLAIVGESGCGKSATALALLGLLPRHAVASARRLRIAGTDLAEADPQACREIWRRHRGGRIAMIFQEPLTALNPVLTVGEQVAEAVRAHEAVSWRAARGRALDLLRRVRIPQAAQRLDAYPHQLSGGMRQRVVIAMALACRPAVLVADEPTTALDVTVQARVLDLIAEIQEETRTALVLITHDLGVVADRADRVLVMYAGRAVESRAAPALFAAPAHPYTRALLAARPRPGWTGARPRLPEIPGRVPGLGERGAAGCPFAPRCAAVLPACRIGRPDPIVLDGGTAACLRAGEFAARETPRAAFG
ncbi:MAG: ABC transporter ATP-binding protein [Methylobacterium sp.]|uniref:ABC transporter ATP-binding protein n=1 Tax=Methylobacterium sp. TaxID=409 RepID=UPI00259076B7|nr:ABC transporter ATP-binding protein [Methylobacterium sp.]MBY0295714.1 ABC transporter ATP-binding protein [Methylobacterium sp.]